MRAFALGMPTRSSASAAFAVASLRSMPKCVSSASRIWRPIVKTGLSDVIGSWKIIAISRPRIERSARSLWRIRSRPSNNARPDSTRPLRASSPRIASDVTLLPQPDSPTIPSVSPGAMSNEMPLTACTVPRLVQKRTWRSSTERSASLATGAQLRVQRLAQPVADQVEPEHRDDDREAGDDREERRDTEVVVHVRQHRSPLRRRRVLWPEAEEAEPGDDPDREQQTGNREHDVHTAHYDGVDDAAEVAGGRAEQEADRDADRDRHDADQEREARPVD